MKIELTKETSFQGIFLWVKVEDSCAGASKCFVESDYEKAVAYLDLLSAHYESHGNFDNINETLISKEVIYNPPTI
jgi:hypothetical protein